MTYLAGFIVIGVKGLFHSDWLGILNEVQICLQLNKLGTCGVIKDAANPLQHKRLDLVTFKRKKLNQLCNQKHSIYL
jgi:hypothetical protein